MLLSSPYLQTRKEQHLAYLTPKQFTQEVKDFIVENLNEQQNQKIKYSANDENWVKEKKMGSFYGVAKGSREPLKFLELEYNGGNLLALLQAFESKLAPYPKKHLLAILHQLLAG